ncbi:retrovirus-related pol polyprotein from transposon TNT 1-94 [Tanacetum coccineum]
MDSMIPIGQRNTLAEYMILSGADNHPPMLDKDLYDSWKSRMELYKQNRENERMILESVEHGQLIWPTIEENGVIRTKKYAELFATEKIQADCDMKEINIILQDQPTDIYSLVNHHRVAKDLWEKVQLLMQGTSLTKQERECKLYDAFDKFAHIKGESLHQYYLRFTQLMNDMNICKIKLEQFQVNTKFLNSLPPEWRTGGNYSGQQRVVKCFNCQGECHIARKCPNPKRKKDATWFRDKVLLLEAQGNGKVLNEEELEFLVDPGIAEAKAVLMANLSSYGSYVLSEIPHSKNTHTDMLNQNVQERPYSKPSHFVEHPENEIHSDSNIIPYSQYLIESQNAAVNKDNLIANESLSAELARYKEQIRPMLYDGNVITKETNVISITDSEETLMLEEESRSKMLLKQKLSNEQALHPNTDQSASSPIKIEAPRELPKKGNRDIVNIAVNSSLDINTSVNVNSSIAMNDSVNYVEMCNKCLELEAEHIKQHNMVEKDEYNKLSKRFSELEQNCISLEVAMQLNKEIFQKNYTFVNQT